MSIFALIFESFVKFGEFSFGSQLSRHFILVGCQCNVTFSILSCLLQKKISHRQFYILAFCSNNNMLCPNKPEAINKLTSANYGLRCAAQNVWSHYAIVAFTTSASHLVLSCLAAFHCLLP